MYAEIEIIPRLIAWYSSNLVPMVYVSLSTYLTVYVLRCIAIDNNPLIVTVLCEVAECCLHLILSCG